MPDAGTAPPKRLAHGVTAYYADASGGPQYYTLSGGEVAPSDRKPLVIGSPLAGERYRSWLQAQYFFADDIVLLLQGGIGVFELTLTSERYYDRQ